MKTKFNSQICTTREQSERLLSLGLKKETADMFWTNPFGDWIAVVGEGSNRDENNIPAWSLHRLIEMMPTMIKKWNQEWELSINNAGVIYSRKDTTAIIEALADNVFDNMVSTIEWLIKEGYFNKEYLCEK